jgi:hypothetical protein
MTKLLRLYSEIASQVDDSGTAGDQHQIAALAALALSLDCMICPGLMGDAIAGKKPALDKLGIKVGNLKKFQSRKRDDRLAEVIRSLEKGYKGPDGLSLRSHRKVLG